MVARKKQWLAVFLVAHLVGLGTAATHLRGDERQAAELLPPTVVAYAEIAQPKQLISRIMDHPLRERIENSPAYDEAWENPQFIQFRAGLAFVELQLGRAWRETLELLTEEGIALGIDTQTEGVVMLVKSSDEALLKKVRDMVLKLTREEAKKKGQGEPVKTAEYRGIEAFQIENAKFAVCGEWLVMTNQGDLGKLIIDRYLDKPQESLASSPQFQKAREQSSSDAAVWGYVDLQTLRSAGVAPELLGGKANDFGGELILGGVLANLQQTPFATGALTLDETRAKLVLATPHDANWIGETREYFFGPQGGGQAPALLQPDETVLTLSAYRDISGMWIRAGDLFNKEVNDQLAAAESGLSTLFSGRDFGEEILGAIHPEIQFVVARQTYEKDQPVPSIKVPSFALVARLKEPERMTRELRRIFQSAVGFFNVVGAMNGQPQLDLDQEQIDGNSLVMATFVPDVDRPDGNGAIHYNFSPSIAFADDVVVISSAVPLARELLALVPHADNQGQAGVNTAIHTNLQVLRDILEDNATHLIAQNVLEKGHSREEAEKEIGGLLTIMKELSQFQMRLIAKDQLRFEMELNLTAQ